MEEGDATKKWQKLFVVCWEFPLVKVAGAAHWCIVDCGVLVFWLQKQIAWFRILTPFISFPLLRSPNKRHKCLISSTTTAELKKRDRDSFFNDGFLIHPSNEAFLVWAVENGCTRWKQPFLEA